MAHVSLSAVVLPDFETCYRAVSSSDARFDGWFVTAVTSTGIYCRPSCPARLPKKQNVRFYPTAAAAQSDGFRACKRCRPELVPGSPEWRARADLTARAMRLIADGVVDREGVGGLARRLGYSERHLTRVLLDELGAGPLALARAQRAQTARVLLDATDLPMAEVAFAAGFASLRQFNATVREVFDASPTSLRRARRTGSRQANGAITLKLRHREPFDARPLFEFLARRAVPGIEAVAFEDDGAPTYIRSLRLEHGNGTIALRPASGHVVGELSLEDTRDLAPAVQRARRLLDLDADPPAVVGVLEMDPLLADLVRASPGLRVPGHVDGAELAIRSILGQQVSLKAAVRLAAGLVERFGDDLSHPRDDVTRLFPTPETLAAVDPAELPMPRSRATALVRLAERLGDGLALDPGRDRDEVRRALAALPGVGPWTVEYVLMRSLSDPDAFLVEDLGLRRALERRGGRWTPATIRERSRRWRPWRAYALHHLWKLDADAATSSTRQRSRRGDAAPIRKRAPAAKLPIGG